MRIKHYDYRFQYSESFENVENDFSYVQLAKHTHKNTKAQKILFVLDYVPSEDLYSGKLLSGATGNLFRSAFQISEKFYNATKSLKDYNWLAVSYHSIKTMGTTDAFKESAYKEFANRLRHIICEYKPDIVVTFGPDPYKCLNREKIEKYGKMHHLYGVPTETTVLYKKRTHSFVHVPTLSLNTLVNDQGSGSEISLLGYVARNLVNALEGKLKYSIPHLDYKITLVDTVEKFDKMLELIKKAKYVAIDTETENLNRRANRMLTIQFAVSTKRAFILPFYHKDSIFLAKELKYISSKLRDFFEHDNKNELHVYTNASFDLTVLRNSVGVRHFHNSIWDIFAGEFCFHPDTQVLTDRGYMKIDGIIDDPNPPSVASFNHDTGEIEYKPLINTSRHQTQEEMYELEYEGGTLRVTGNHKVWSITRNAYVRVDEIKEGEELIVKED